MKRRIGIALLLGTLLLISSACKGKHPEPEATRPKGDKKTEEKGGLITLSPESKALAEISVEEVAVRPLRHELQVSGTLQANENRLTHVGSRIPGRILEVMADLGDRVKKGGKLALIDSPELGQAQSEYLTTRAKLLVTEKAYERARTLVEGKVLGKGEFQRREGEFLSARAEAQAARNRLHLLGLAEEEISLLEEKNAIYSQVVIASPLSGKVIERHVTVGEIVEPVKTLFTVADLSTLWGIADLPEQDLPKVTNGLVAEVSVSSYKERFEGKITYISDTIDPASRTVKVRIEIGNAEEKLKPEMFALFHILTRETEKTAIIPESAVQREGDQTIVFVASERGGFEKRKITIGSQLQGFYPVLSGLKPGERIVTKGSFILKSESLKGEIGEE